MSRSARLLRLLSAFRRLPQPVTAERLAEEMEVSTRTLYRDIGELRAGGALIDGEAGLGYTLTEDPALPPQMFDRLEVEALVLGLAEVRMMSDPDLARAAEGAMAKITATLPERVQRQAIHAALSVYRSERRPPPPPHMALIREAIWGERAVDIRYCDKAGERTERRVWPLSIVFLDRAMMLLAFCTMRQDFRRFHLSGIEFAGLSKESFRPRRVPLLRAFIRQLKGEQSPSRT